MNPEASAETAVLASAILTLLAIAAKLVTAHLVTRSRHTYTKLDARRRDSVGRLKEAQLKRTSARGTLEFWERRRGEAAQRFQDVMRDLEAYQDMFGGPAEEVDEGVGPEGVGGDPDVAPDAAGQSPSLRPEASAEGDEGEGGGEGGPAQAAAQGPTTEGAAPEDASASHSGVDEGEPRRETG